MKKLLAILTIMALCAVTTFSAHAQSIAPRFDSTGISGDNTGRVLNYHYATLSDAAGNDTTSLNPRAWDNVYAVHLNDSTSLKFYTINNSYLGDKITIIATGASGTKLKFADANWLSTGTATLSSGGVAILRFIFDGTKWAELSRVVQ